MLLLLLLIGTVAASDEILPVDAAFPHTVTATEKNIQLQFGIQPRYYLYRHAFQFAGQNIQLGEANIPPGKKKTDEFFGEVETYRDVLTITIPYSGVQASPALEVKFQGCADAGICYPPQKRVLDLTEHVAQNNATSAVLPASSSGNLLTSSQGQSFFSDQNLLPVDQAFKFETIALSDTVLSARFTMAPNIYLYKDQVVFSTFTHGVTLGEPEFPAAVKKDDPEFGLVDVFYDVVEINIPYSRSQAVNRVDVEVAFQGCEDGKVCYPPDSRVVSVDVPDAQLLADVKAPSAAGDLSETQQLTQDIASQSAIIVLLQFFGLGLLLSVTPCVYPMIPILSSLIVGQKDPSTRKAFVLSLTYVLAMALTYTLVGVVAGLLGANLQAMFQKPEIIITFSLVFVLLSLSMFGYYDLQLPKSWQNKLSAISNRQKGGSVLGVAIMGLLSALIVGPCVAPPLAAAVIYISTHDSGAVMGGLALFAMSFGMGVPLIAIGTSAGKWMPSSGGWMNVVKSFFGIALLGMAVWFLSRILDANVILFMWAVLLIVSAVMWHRHAKDNGLSGAALGLVEGLKVLALLVGVAQLLGAMAGGSDPIRPLKGVFGGGAAIESKGLSFTKIKSLSELEQALKASKKPVYFDFYADWCVECKRMEATTFKDPGIVELGRQFTLLKADVTANDEVDAALMKHFQVVGPPASLFFAPGGAPLVQYNFFGYKSAADLKQTFENILINSTPL